MCRFRKLLQISKPLPVETPRKPSRRVLQRLEKIERLPRRKQAALLTTMVACVSTDCGEHQGVVIWTHSSPDFSITFFHTAKNGNASFPRDGYVDDPTSTTVPGRMVRNASMQAGTCGFKSTTRFERAHTISSAILRPVRFC